MAYCSSSVFFGLMLTVIYASHSARSATLSKPAELSDELIAMLLCQEAAQQHLQDSSQLIRDMCSSSKMFREDAKVKADGGNLRNGMPESENIEDRQRPLQSKTTKRQDEAWNRFMRKNEFIRFG